MVAVAVKPFLMNDCTLVVGTDNYEAHVSTVRFDPTTNLVRWAGLTPASKFSFPTDPDWTCTLSYAQDWTTLNSLSQYLMANAGKTIDVTFKPKAADAKQVKAKLVIVPGSIGGDIGAVAVASVTCGVEGVPTITTVP